MKMTKVDVRVSVETREKLDEIAKVLRVNRADLIRASFKRYITAFDNGDIFADMSDSIIKKDLKNGKEK